MPHSLNKIWVHVIWATKYRRPLIQQDFEHVLHQFISDQLRELGCQVSIINGMPDHLHCLFLLNPQKSIAEVMKQIKGSSSHYINQNDFIKEKFSWQTGYAAFTVSESGINSVFNYIKNQKSHHQTKSFRKEYKAFQERHGLQN
ncbi:MAG: IS200/IS605 family transposase [Flavobacteriales bacterium]|nr:IS200/IS605 family transposase [Flavobacteriales bacterium]